mmetsp:Transcript_11856/g.24486  ORF Transcript_11856/g.24486 Transcript_11856/m.24486 type:complete len:100 (+) Transcript_11856:255-554(+)
MLQVSLRCGTGGSSRFGGTISLLDMLIDYVITQIKMYWKDPNLFQSVLCSSLVIVVWVVASAHRYRIGSNAFLIPSFSFHWLWWSSRWLVVMSGNAVFG